MGNVPIINVGGTDYNVKDTLARNAQSANGGFVYMADEVFHFPQSVILSTNSYGFYLRKNLRAIYFKPITSKETPKITYNRYICENGIADGNEYSLVETKISSANGTVCFEHIKSNEFIIAVMETGTGYYSNSNFAYNASLCYFDGNNKLKTLPQYCFAGTLGIVEYKYDNDDENNKSQTNILLSENEISEKTFTNPSSRNASDVEAWGFTFDDDIFAVDYTPSFSGNSGTYLLTTVQVDSDLTITKVLSQTRCKIGETIRLADVKKDKAYILSSMMDNDGVRLYARYATGYITNGLYIPFMSYKNIKAGEPVNSVISYGCLSGTYKIIEPIKTIPDYILNGTVIDKKEYSLPFSYGLSDAHWGFAFKGKYYKVRIKPTSYCADSSSSVTYTGKCFYFRRCKLENGVVVSMSPEMKVVAGKWLDLYNVDENDFFAITHVFRDDNGACVFSYKANGGAPTVIGYTAETTVVGDTITFLNQYGITADYEFYTAALKTNGADDYAGATIYAFGDSRTWYDGQPYGDTTKEEWRGRTCVGYQQTINRILGCNITTFGYNGQNSEYICARIREKSFVGVHAVILDGGVNDYIVGNTALGSLQPIGSTFDTNSVYGAWQSAIEHIMTSNPACKIIINTPYVCWNANGILPENIAMVKKNIAELYSIECNDLYHYSGINLVNRDYFFVDDYTRPTQWRLHLNDYGNAWIGEKIAKFMLGF